MRYRGGSIAPIRAIARATPPLGVALTGILLQTWGGLGPLSYLARLLAMAILATTSRAIRTAPDHSA